MCIDQTFVTSIPGIIIIPPMTLQLPMNWVIPKYHKGYNKDERVGQMCTKYFLRGPPQITSMAIKLMSISM